MSDFSIKTPVFEGPLELLIDLVEKRKLLINDISLASVTDEYMATVSKMQEMSLPNTANFIVLAATLLLIKSKSLLPVLDLTEEEEKSIDDLENRLRLYQIYKDVSTGIINQFGTNILHERLYIPIKSPLFITDKFCNLNELRDAIGRVMSELPLKEQKPKVQIKKVISIEQMIDNLHRRIERQFKIKFSELVENTREKQVLIVGFLAVLESVKQGSILANQSQRFTDIDIEHTKPTLPRYI